MEKHNTKDMLAGPRIFTSGGIVPITEMLCDVTLSPFIFRVFCLCDVTSLFHRLFFVFFAFVT